MLADVASSLAAYVDRQADIGAALAELGFAWACQHVAQLAGSLYYEANYQLSLTGGRLTASDWALMAAAPQLCSLLSRQVAADSSSKQQQAAAHSSRRRQQAAIRTL